MKHKILLVTAFSFLSCLSLHADTPLEEKMTIMKKSFKELSKSLQTPVDADKEKYLKLITSLRDATAQSKDLKPQKIDEIPAEKQAAFIEGYQKKIDETVAQIDLLKQAVDQANWPEAQKLISALKKSQGEAHKEYRSERP